jgi:uncharacterized protein
VLVTFDQPKRDATLLERGLAFEDAKFVFVGKTVEIEDRRSDYGEVRTICFGKLSGRMVVVGYVQRGETRHVFSMRKANEREQKTFGELLEE